jgi:hypothetical protein
LHYSEGDESDLQIYSGIYEIPSVERGSVYGSRLGMKFYDCEGAIVPLKRRGNNVRNGTFYDYVLCIEPDLPLFLAVSRQNKTL